MRRGVALVVVAGIATALALAVFPGHTELVLDLYVLLLGAVALGVLVGSVRRENPVPASSPFERALRRPSRRQERLPDLARLERELGLAAQSAADVHFRLRPRLRRIASRLLFTRRGVDLDAEPETARRLLGDDLWDVVRADRDPPRRRDEAGLPLAAAEGMIATLERL